MKKLITLLASMALVASGLHILPAAAAEEAPEVPAVVNIEDLVNDANYLNDQGLLTEFQGDNATPSDASTLGDILKVWFTNDATKVNVHVQTQAAIPADGNNAAIFHRVQVDPDGAGETCLWFQGGTTGHTNAVGPVANLRDTCGDADEVLGEGELKMETGPDDTGIITISVDRSLHSALGVGGKLLTPKAETRNYFATPVRTQTVPQIDNTKPGTDFLLIEDTAGNSGKTPPGKNPIPGKKKGCDKGKGKKRGCEGKGKKSPKPGKPAAKCAPFAPGEAGAEKPTVVLTDAATEAAPVEQKITLDPSVGDADVVGAGHEVGGLPAPAGPGTDYFNIQLDARAADAGLYVLFEFPERRDYDINLLHPDGSYAARSHGMNLMIPEGRPTEMTNEAGHGGASTTSSESLVGIRTAPCGGWTLETANWLGEGGEMTVKLWLGEIQNDPQDLGAEAP